MRTASTTEAPGATPGGARPDHSRRLLAAGVILGVAALMRGVFHGWFLNYDARYALLWASDLWHGFTPDFRAGFAATPHPLSIAVSSLALPFGSSGDQVIAWIELLSFGALVWLSYRLGEVLFSRWIGVVSAIAVATRPALERDAVVAYQDVPFAALVLAAVLLEARQRRRGWPVLGLLVLAGLIRPEAWILSGIYWVYLWPASSPRQRLLLAVLAAGAPLLWATMDLAVTGDALHSVHDTATVARESHLRRDIGQAPGWSARFLVFTLREPVTLGVLIGLWLAWRHRRAQAVLVIAVAAAMTAVSTIEPAFGLPLLARYIRTPAVLLTLFFGVAVAGWALMPRGRDRRTWLVAGMVTLAVSLAFVPANFTQIRALQTRTARESAFYRSLRRGATSPLVARAFAACQPLSLADHRPLPFVRYWLHGRPGSVTTVERGSSPLGKLLLLPRRSLSNSRFYGRNFPHVTSPPGYRRVYEDRGWALYAAPPCARAARPSRR